MTSLRDMMAIARAELHASRVESEVEPKAGAGSRSSASAAVVGELLVGKQAAGGKARVSTAPAPQGEESEVGGGKPPIATMFQGSPVPS
jgi:hypothetical protein